MQRSPRSAPQATISSLRGLSIGLVLACALSSLAWPALAAAQDGSAAVDQSKAKTSPADPLGARQNESFPAPALSQPASPAATAPGEERINFEADQVEYGSDTQIVTAAGNVVLVKGDQSVHADNVVWNRQSGQIVATGNVRAVDQDGNLLLTDRVELTDELKAGMIENLLLVMREGGRIAADKGVRDAAGRIILTNAAYTACAVENTSGCAKRPSWRINAKRVIYDPVSQRVRYVGAKLEIFGIAVPLPLLAHSTNGSAGSGLLPPSLGFSRSNGVEFQQGYYLRLSQSRDLTVAGHVYSQVLPMISAQYRELTDIAAYQITGYATRSPRLPIDQTGATSRLDFRGAIDANGRFQFSPEWSLTSSARLATDRTFLRRYEISRDDRLRNTINLERIDPDSYLSIAAWATQTLQVGVNQGQVPIALPAIDYRRRLTVPVIGGKVELQANSLGIIRGDGQDSQRAFAGARWDLRKITLAGLDATLTGLVRGDVYHSDENFLTATAAYRGTPGWQARGIALAAIDVKYPLVGAFLGGTQILTPRIQVVASPSINNFDIPNEDSRAIELEDTNLFALNRFPGYDRVEDGTRFTYGIDWRFERPEWRVSSTIGQSYRLTSKPSFFPNGTGLTSRTSDVVGRTQVRYREFVSLTHRFRLDKDGLAVRRNEFDATIGSHKTYLELGYLRLNRDIAAFEDLQDREELRVAGRVAFAHYWSVFGSGVFNLTDRNEDPSFTSDGFQPLRTRLGVAYADECLEMSLTFRRDYVSTGDARKGNSFLVRLALKNLGFR